jgi:hypothetical protein
MSSGKIRRDGQKFDALTFCEIFKRDENVFWFHSNEITAEIPGKP